MTSPPATARPRSSVQGDGQRRHRDPKDGLWRVHIIQGDAYVTSAPDEILTTVLGSCVAACMRDTSTGVGGMNHFLLPESTGQDRLAMRYGVNAMEILINGILSRGGVRRRLEAKLFGGANVMAALSDVGARNMEFAQKFLADESIPVVGGHLGGTSARRIQFWPQSGRVRQMVVTSLDTHLIESELRQAQQEIATSSEQGHDVELF